MYELKDNHVLVLGLGGRGVAACELLLASGARVTAADSADTAELRQAAGPLEAQGVKVLLGAAEAPGVEFSLAVISPAVASQSPLVQSVVRRGVPLVSELELGFQRAQCLAVTIAGTNGKGTTAELIERVLTANHRRVARAGHRAVPICRVAGQTRDLDFLILQVNSFQLEHTHYFRPAVAVLMNLAPDHLDRYASAADYVRANARLFRNQQPFDWAIVQSEALARLREQAEPPQAKTITFSATDPEADLHLDRGLLISRLPNWAGPLLNLDHCHLRGPHNAENLMAALAIGHVLRQPLEAMADPLKTYSGGAHRFELVAEINGVQFINDSKATNIDALDKALQAARPGRTGEANVWLIAGGREKGQEFHYVGPLLSKRVKRAFLIGEAREKLRASWGLFTPCTVSNSLLEAVAEAARNATSGDVVLLSPACSSFDQFRNYQHRGEVFCQAVKSISGGGPGANPNINGRITEITDIE